jgi:drug/metabolite transporter (DMT)-like permease
VDRPERDGARTTVLLVAVGVLAVSFAAPISATIAAPALAVAFWRNTFGTLVVAPYAVVRRRGELARVLRHDRRTMWLALGAGAWLAAHFALWVPSLRMTSVTASTALVTTTPLWTLAFERLRGRRAPRQVLLGVLVAFAGVLLVTGVDAGSGGRALLGDLMALAAGAAAAAYTLLGSAVRRSVSTTSYTTVAYGTCALLLVPVALVAGQPLAGFSARTWGELVALTLTAQLLGHSLLNRALPVAGATTVALAILFEVPGAALIAWALFGQRPPVAVLPGAVLLLTGLAVVVRGPGSRWRPRLTVRSTGGRRPARTRSAGPPPARRTGRPSGGAEVVRVVAGELGDVARRRAGHVLDRRGDGRRLAPAVDDLIG